MQHHPLLPRDQVNPFSRFRLPVELAESGCAKNAQTIKAKASSSHDLAPRVRQYSWGTPVAAPLVKNELELAKFMIALPFVRQKCLPAS